LAETSDAVIAEWVLNSSRYRVARELRRVAGTMLVCLPIGMAVANRSGPLFVTLAALATLAAIVTEKRHLVVLRRARSALLDPLGLAVAVFVAWSVLSLAWSSSPARSAAALGEALLPAAAAFVMSLGLSGQLRYFTGRSASRSLAAGIAAACLMVMCDRATGMQLHRALGLPGALAELNRSVLTIVVIGAPTLWWLARGRHVPSWSLAALAGLIAVTAFSSISGAATVGLSAATAVFIFARIFPRFATGAVLIGSGTSLAAAPVMGEILHKTLPPRFHELLAGTSSEARIQIWRSFGAAVREQLWGGIGFGASSEIAQASVAQTIPLDYRPMLAAGHPHNAALQIWVETGVVGAMAAFLVIALLLRSMARLHPRDRAPRLALLAGAGLAALVGHGAWQGWWIAAIGAAVTLFRTMDQETAHALVKSDLP
jgi:O-antigen ligase